MLGAGMRLSLQLQYAICGLFDLACNDEGKPIRIRAICERQQIPLRYLEQIFQRLRRAEIVTSRRGPGGGYTLARSPSEISLRAVVEAVEGSLAEGFRMSPASGDGGAPYRPDFLWADLASRFADALEETTLERLRREALDAQVEPDSAGVPAYRI
jgi:Rrf2 family iron-sulfur cluster assembly transcriptional regulator